MDQELKQTINLLLVEDDIPTQDFMMLALGKRFQIVTAVSAQEALVVLNRQLVDIILMDLSLKGNEDGIDLTKRIRTIPRLQQIPIIALTAHAYDRDRENALNAGCDAYYPKPFNRADLLTEIDELITFGRRI
jgi:CheY-like chemotaxis protein